MGPAEALPSKIDGYRAINKPAMITHTASICFHVYLFFKSTKEKNMAIGIVTTV